jgi:hypothetical protein
MPQDVQYDTRTCTTPYHTTHRGEEERRGEERRGSK